MTLGPGTRVGPYEVSTLLGEGGMGKVWRARHTSLGRDDALKVLPDAFAADPERLHRFNREAQLLASLNHPHIAQVHGFEHVDGTAVLVMELVEGPTLADRIAGGAIPLDEALSIARQIAEALEAAHEQGIVHRDLKPANIKVRDDGTVKVLDFGLAKLTQPPGSHSSGVSQAPTITSPAMTQVGMLLGTAAYMSPEQAKGREADKRSDIWAFGCVVFEMLTGQRAFGGEDVAETLAAVLAREPDWIRLPAGLPPIVAGLLEACLQRDRRARLGDIAAVRFAIEQAGRDPFRAAAPESVNARSQTKTPLRMMIAGALAALAAAAAAGTTWLAMRPEPPRVARFPAIPAGETPLSPNPNIRDFAVSPDGSFLVYAGITGRRQLFMRSMDALTPVALDGLGAPSSPFLSPDGQWIGFLDVVSNSLKKVRVSGGPVVELARVADGFRGATWSPDGTIVFATNNTTMGLQRIPEAGGEAEVLTRPSSGERAHVFPRMLPGGGALLFDIVPASLRIEEYQIVVLDLRSRARTVVLRGGFDAHYVATGHLVYAVADSLRAVRFDIDRRAVVGSAVPVLAGVRAGGDVRIGHFDVAGDGTLVYAPAGQSEGQQRRTLVWVDRQGREEPIAADERTYQYPRISPDGTRIAVAAFDQQQDVLLWDVARRTLSRFTLDQRRETYPVWAPDAAHLIYSAQQSGVRQLFRQRLDGGQPEFLSRGPNNRDPLSVSPDGRWLVFRIDGASQDLAMLELNGARAERPLLQTAANEMNGEVSPDGRWLAYQSNESGRDEIYVRRFPDAETGQAQVTTDGGTRPVWSTKGDELFYLAPSGALMAVQVEATSTWTPHTPRKILEGPFYTGEGSASVGRSYDVSRDGERFLMIKEAAAGGSGPSLVVVQHWAEELKRLVPAR